jgi:putative acetyltransferase
MDAPRAFRIRDETTADAAAVRQVIVAAFKSRIEADLVDRLRAHGKIAAALVATLGNAVAGHIMLTDVALRGTGLPPRGAALAPLAVRPAMQRRGIGSDLARAAIARAREVGYGFMVVLGDPAYYRRFGFAAGAALGLACEFDAPLEAFMAMELSPGALAGARGLVQYEPEFDSV